MIQMLCRVADSLFWMSRYIERAENTARLVDVNLQLLLDADRISPTPEKDFWLPTLESTGDAAIFSKLYDDANNDNVMEFLTFNRDNPSSIISCVFAARENARMIRDQISGEMWEIVNRLYHHLKRGSSYHVGHSSLYDLFKEIREASALFAGTTESTHPHDVGYEFIKIGRFLERADKTGRILDSKKHLMSDEQADPATLTHWGAVLRACSATSAYQQIYQMDFRPSRILALLIFSRNFPRSVLFSLYELQAAIHAVSGCPVSHYSNETERKCGRLISALSYTSIEEVMQGDVHEFLQGIKRDIEGVAMDLSQQYMFFPVIDPANEAAEA